MHFKKNAGQIELKISEIELFSLLFETNNSFRFI